MHLRISIIFLVPLLGCGPTDSETEDAPNDQQADVPPLVSAGPGRDASVPLECASVECLERPDGDYQLLARCENTGAIRDESCPDAVLSWESLAVSGDLSWFAGAFEIEVDQTIAWDIQYPAKCATCEELEQQEQFAELDCSEGSDGCSCTGTVQENFRLLGGEATLADGTLISVIESTGPDGAVDTTPRDFEVAGCTDGANLLLYYENGQRYYFEKL